eukprot:g11782.t1
MDLELWNATSQDGVISLMDVGNVMQLSAFDYLRRALEALLSGASLALEVAAFAALLLDKKFWTHLDPRPYTGDLPFTSPTELFAASGEQRHVYLDVGKGLSFVGPFASYVSRSSSDTVTFTAGDQVIQLQAVQEMTLRAAKALPQESAPLTPRADDRPVGRSCQSEVGYWSPVCNNTWHACDLPTGISASQFSSVANFTTTGRGAADGCEITLAFVAAKPPAQSFAVAALAPPFTVEAFVNMTLDAIPTGESSVSSMAVLFGSFPSWYLALRRVSAGQAQLVFYHSRLTLASHISAEDSTISSSSFSWDNAREPWRHVADGTFISSGYRSVAAMDILEAPYIIPEHRDVFHVGPVNMKRFPEVLSSGRPYYDLAMYTAQLDEVRVHQEALDTLTLGFQITELRRLAACNTPLGVSSEVPGEGRNATVYDADHHILGQLGYVTLPRRIALAEAAQVAVVEVWGGASATSVSLEVETPAPESLRLAVPELRSVLLQADRPALLHHRLALDYDDPTLSCARCPGEAPRSVLPRSDARTASERTAWEQAETMRRVERGAASRQVQEAQQERDSQVTHGTASD